MPARGCPCGFTDPQGIAKWSKPWHELHQAHHLAAYPDLDQRSRDNLALFIEWAS